MTYPTTSLPTCRSSMDIAKKGFDQVDTKGGFVRKVPLVSHEVDVKELISRGLPVVLLVDSDIIAYRSAAAADGRQYSCGDGEVFRYKKDAVGYCEEHELDPKAAVELVFKPEPPENAISNVDKLIKKIQRVIGRPLKEAGIEWTMEHYLTPPITFRMDVKSDYKANRKDQRRPENLKACKDHLTQEHNAMTVEGYEADDLLAIRATELMDKGSTPVIVSLDKDLDQIVCFHYNFVKDLLYFTTETEARLNLHKQLLMGDAVDNIPGIPKVGPKTAEKILADVDDNDVAMYRACLHTYIKKMPRLEEDGTLESDEVFYTRMIAQVTQTMRLLYLCREYGEVWVPPSEAPLPPEQVCPECDGQKEYHQIVCDACYSKDKSLTNKHRGRKV